MMCAAGWLLQMVVEVVVVMARSVAGLLGGRNGDIAVVWMCGGVVMSSAGWLLQAVVVVAVVVVASSWSVGGRKGYIEVA